MFLMPVNLGMQFLLLWNGKFFGIKSDEIFEKMFVDE